VAHLHRSSVEIITIRQDVDSADKETNLTAGIEQKI
jgi:hypothetical protein